MDNERYRKAGAPRTGSGVDSTGAAPGLAGALRVADPAAPDAAVAAVLPAPGPAPLNARISAAPVPRTARIRDGAPMPLRFREGLGVE